MKNHPVAPRLLPLALIASALVIAACGDEDAGSAEPQAAPEPPAANAGQPAGGGDKVPKALADNRAQANEIIDGSTEALEAKLEELRGHPVVVNQWGSWCPPCRAEFPFFAEIAEAHAADVAFVGVDIQDDREAAEAFLEDFPVRYPHIFDVDAQAVFELLDWRQVSPSTWFIDERGEIVHQRPGAYPDGAALEADIERHLGV